MVLGSDQGAVVSVDGGSSWSSWLNQPTAQFYHVAADNQFPYYVYGAQQDSGTVATASRSDFGAITYRDWYSVGGGESGYIVPDPRNPNVVFAGDTYGKLFRFDRSTNQARDVSPNPVTVWGAEIKDSPLRFTWTSPLVFSPQDPSALYFGSQFVMKTTDGGSSWHVISPDLTGAAAEAPHDVPLGVSNAKSMGYGVVYSIAPSPLDPKLIWSGSDTGMIYVTRDGAKTWNSATPKCLNDWSKISVLEASHFDRDTVYAAVDRHRLDDYEPHILRTHDGGRSWQEITAGIAGPDYVQAVREDPVRKGLLYAATEKTVYLSFDDGDRWESLRLNLPIVPVHDLIVHLDDLVIATHGRSFWILDDVEPLRELDAGIAASAAHLFSPQTATRVRPSVNNDTPLTPEMPMGKNPPAGAVIDYYLARAARMVTLEIMDASGNLVRRYSSEDQPEPVPGNLRFPSSWIRRVEPLDKTAGMHRVTWDLCYPQPKVLNPDYSTAVLYGGNTPEATLGPLGLPGVYQVRLTVDGHAQTRPLTLNLDPRIRATQQELAAQFELEVRVAQAIDLDAAAAAEIRSALDQLEALSRPDSATKGWDGVMASIRSLDTKIRALGKAADDNQESDFIRLNQRLATLLSAIESADAAPTAQETAAARDLTQELSKLVAAWEALKGGDLAALNRELDKAHLARIKIQG